MYVQQFFIKGISHSSYLLGADKECAIIDPARDIDIYIEAANEMGMKITKILETHLHADFISGHLDLAKKTGAEIYAPASAECRFKHNPVKENDIIIMENVRLKVIETPGHTPEHITYIVSDLSRGKEPVGIFCGDTLFVGDVGRPDLFPGMAEELASKLFDSLKKLKKLPDFTEVYPAHGAGSLCGRAMGAKRRTTIGYERLHNEPFSMTDRKKFIHSLTNNMPAAPDHFARCSDINRKGPALISKLPKLEAMNPPDFKKAMKGKTIVLDIRDYDAYGAQHIENSFAIDFGGNFATFAGWVLPPDKNILLVAANGKQAESAVKWLRRVGLDNVTGYLKGGMFEWMKAGYEAGHIQQMSPHEIADAMKTGEYQLIDVRAENEFNTMRIKGTNNIPAPETRTRFREIDKTKHIILMCTTGHRSSLAASILARHGFKRLINAAGGITGYEAAGLTVEH